jgi:hypothetical protein
MRVCLSVRGSFVFLCVLCHLSRPFRPEYTIALLFCAHSPCLNKRHLAGVFVGTAALPGGLSGAMDLKLPLDSSTLLFLHKHTLSQLTSHSCAPLSLSHF